MASALPYVDIPTWKIIGDHELTIFGPFAVLGVMIGFRRVLHYARARGLDVAATDRLTTWVVACGFVGAHWVSMLLYYPDRVVEDPWVLLYIGSGLSSVGGFLGGALAFVVLARRRGLRLREHADAIAFGLLAGFTIGRVGCSLVHDHPGAVSSSWLAVGPWPDGTWRYDLALVELSGLVVLCVAIYLVFDWRRAPPGRLTALLATLYGVARFPLDFLRAADTRYLGLTPAQFACLAFVATGVVLLLETRGCAPSSAAHPRAPT